MRKVFLIVVPVAFAGLFLLAWNYFHSIPRQADLRDLLQRADAVEIFRFKDGKMVRWVRFEDPTRWKDLAPRINFKQRYWLFSKAPTDSVVLQALVDDQRHLWEVRNDGCIHVRKAVRWYRMPVEPQFETRLREILQENGEDLEQ